MRRSHGKTGLLPEHLHFCKNEISNIHHSRDINLRASALAAVGMLGGDEDIALLEGNAASGLYRVRTAARAALTRLERKRAKAG